MNKNTLLITGLGLAFAAIPLISSAQTLTATVGTPVATSAAVASPIAVMGPGPACPPFLRSLYIGATGTDVTSLQSFLNTRGYLKVSPTGYFGPLTRAAVASWQADGNVAAQGSAGSGIFGPLSRAFFLRSCGGGSLGIRPGFYANPQSGSAPLTVQFSSSEPSGTDLGARVEFGDGSEGTLAFAPTCAQCNPIATVSHTYTASGTYTATLTDAPCACPDGGTCFCPNIRVLATTTVAVGPAATTTASIQQVNAPASVALTPGGIAEVRNEHYYFTLESVTSNSATIQPTAVGCWNSFPSDTPPEIRCMIAVMPLAPQTLTVGQTYANGNFNITLTQVSGTTATFSVNVPPTPATASAQ